jgi:hypothetical protein
METVALDPKRRRSFPAVGKLAHCKLRLRSGIRRQHQDVFLHRRHAVAGRHLLDPVDGVWISLLRRDDLAFAQLLHEAEHRALLRFGQPPHRSISASSDDRQQLFVTAVRWAAMCTTVDRLARDLVARGVPLDDYIEDLRVAVVRQALKEYGSTARAARMLAMDRKTLRRIRDRFGL